MDEPAEQVGSETQAMQDFDVLVLRYLDDAQDEAAARQLNALLADSSELRARYVRLCRRSSEIREIVLNRSERAFGNATTIEPPIEANQLARRGGGESAGSRWRLKSVNPRYAAAAAVLLCASLALAWLVWVGSGADWPQGAVARLDGSFTHAANARDAEPVYFMPGDTRVTDAGQPVQVRMGDGTTVVLAGGSELVFVADDRVRLKRGSLVARAESGASGFTVLTPRSRVVDLGTEFGVEVGEDREERVHLFEGRVDVFGPTGDPARLSAGQASRVAPDGTLTVYDAGLADRFLRILPGSRFAGEALRLGPVLYLPMDGPGAAPIPPSVMRESTAFEHGLDEERIVRDSAVGDDGLSLELRYVDDPLTVKGPMRAVNASGAYSFVLWVKPKRLASQNLITATSSRGPALDIGPQVRLLPDGRVEHVSPGGAAVQRSSARLDAGRWSLILAVRDRGGTMRLYLNGVPAAPERDAGRSVSENLDTLAIGGPAGQRVGLSHTFRAYDGLIDELLVFDRALTTDQAEALYEARR